MGSQRNINYNVYRHPFLVIVLTLLSFFGLARAATKLPEPVNLTWRYYEKNTTCRDAEIYVRHQVGLMWNITKDKTILPKLLKILYSDCFVTGCDASILLDGDNSEQNAPQNKGLELKKFVLIDKIKTVLEKRCPGVVSCADIIHLATRDAIHLAGGPSYPVFTGRRDGMSSDAKSVNLPFANISLDSAIAYFESKGLDQLDLATLLGAHGMGRTHCRNIEDRLYNYNGTKKTDPTMASSLLKKLRKECPNRKTQSQSDPLVNLNPNPGREYYNFTVLYYKNVKNRQAVLGIDQKLLYGTDTKKIVNEFASRLENYKKRFALSISRAGSLDVLTRNQGEIRRDCRYTNKDNPRLK